MHDTAYEHGRLFFELYGSADLRTVVELGSQNVNGSIRDHCPAGVHYIGLDITQATGVDIVVDAAHALPLASNIADAVLSSSVFEHDICFWDTFLELIRILRPGGLLYVNAPANGGFHRHPLDCWRFYPDAGAALVRWAARRGVTVELAESFIGQPRTEGWADFVAVFHKPGREPLVRTGLIAKRVSAINIYDIDTPAGAALDTEKPDMPDQRIAGELRAQITIATDRYSDLSADFTAAKRNNASLSTALSVKRNEAVSLQQRLVAAENRIADLEDAHTLVKRDFAAILGSTSWRMTAGLRRMMAIIRGH